MSLWSHGDDREVYRAQHLFCHRAEEQLADLAPAPSPKNETICFELTSRRDDLLSGVAFANDGITGNLLRAGHRSERLEGLDGKVDGACGIVVGHADGI